MLRLVAGSMPSNHLPQCWLNAKSTLKQEPKWKSVQNINIFYEENTSEKVICHVQPCFLIPQHINDKLYPIVDCPRHTWECISRTKHPYQIYLNHVKYAGEKQTFFMYSVCWWILGVVFTSVVWSPVSDNSVSQISSYGGLLWVHPEIMVINQKTCSCSLINSWV